MVANYVSYSHFPVNPVIRSDQDRSRNLFSLKNANKFSHNQYFGAHHPKHYKKLSFSELHVTKKNLEIVLFLLHPHYYTPLTPLKRESTHNLNLLPKCLDDNIDFYRRLIQMLPIEPWRNST